MNEDKIITIRHRERSKYTAIILLILGSSIIPVLSLFFNQIRDWGLASVEYRLWATVFIGAIPAFIILFSVCGWVIHKTLTKILRAHHLKSHLMQANLADVLTAMSLLAGSSMTAGFMRGYMPGDTMSLIDFSKGLLLAPVFTVGIALCLLIVALLLGIKDRFMKSAE